jgi:Ca2+-binding RTX toxin-like protein
MATIIGTNGNNSLAGTTAADTMIGRAGNDQLLGNGGNDRLNGGTHNDVLNGGSGIDTADYSNLIIGGTTYIGATSGVIVNLNLAGVQNTVGAGLDTLVSIENLTGSNFRDALAGNSSTNVLSGLAGNDILAGAGGTDQLFGGDGNDLLNGGTHNDLLIGGLGSDTADYGTYTIGRQPVIGATAGVTVNLNLAGAQNTRGAGSDTLVSIENLTGSDFHDVLTGNSANNVLTGRAGNDTLNGGNGNDTLQGDSGNDTLNGGDGIDTVSYRTATAGVTVEISDYGGESTGGGGNDDFEEIENLIGSNFNDMIYGTNFSGGTFNGGAGNDRIGGDDGLFTLNGEAGDDELFSGHGSGSTLNGGDGNDRLEAGQGFITLNGGAGNDRLFVDNAVEYGKSTMTGGAGADTFGYSRNNFGLVSVDITDFNGAGSGIGDQIDLTDIDAIEDLLEGEDNQAFIFGGPFTAGHLRYVGGVLQGNTDGDTAAEFEIQLLGAPALVVGGVGTDILL